MLNNLAHGILKHISQYALAAMKDNSHTSITSDEVYQVLNVLNEKIGRHVKNQMSADQ